MKSLNEGKLHFILYVTEQQIIESQTLQQKSMKKLRHQEQNNQSVQEDQKNVIRRQFDHRVNYKHIKSKIVL